MASIKKLKNSNETIYPITIPEAIKVSNGLDLIDGLGIIGGGV